VKTTGCAGATQTNIALKNAYGSSLIPGTATADQTYISNIFRVGDPVALVRAAASWSSGPSSLHRHGFGCRLHRHHVQRVSITPTANDILISPVPQR
jgi:hypothetical protein